MNWFGWFLLLLGVECALCIEMKLPVVSSCHLFPEGTSPWVKGARDPIRSWIQSLVPASYQVPKTHYLFADLILDSSGLQHRVNAVYTETIIWEAFGDSPNDGWTYSEVLAVGLTQTFYIYSDFRSAIRGHFRNGVLASGVETKINSYRCNGGILELKFSNKPPSYYRKNPALYGHKIPTFQFDQNTLTFITSSPTLMDPLDRANLRIGTSDMPGIVGDALRARRDIPAFTVVSYYAGTKVYDMSVLFSPNMTIDERENIHKNLLSFNKEFDLNVPPPMDNILFYRATLAHKANHSFRPNTKFGYVKHPRFGETRCLVSTRPIKKGEEITVSYGYNLKSTSIPRWYRKLYKETYNDEDDDE